MGFKMKGFNAGKGTGSSKLFSKPSPTKQTQILQGAPNPYSIYDKRREAGMDVSDTAKSNKERRWEAANLQANPSEIFSGEEVTQDWNQEATGAAESQIEHRRRDPSQFDLDGNGRLNRKERKALKEHEEHIQRKASNPMFSDLKKDRSQSQLTASMVEKGYSQVQDPYGNWHVMNKSGALTHGGSGYSPESRAWRNRESINPMYDPGSKVDLSIRYAPKEKKGTVDVGEITGGNTKITDKPDKVKPPKKIKDKTFGEAFKEARKDKQKIFEWKGKKYHSRRADEKKVDWEKLFKAKGTPSPGPEPK